MSDKELPIFSQSPKHDEKHPLNYLTFFGELLMSYRRSLPVPLRHQQEFCEQLLQKYVDSKVDRKRLKRAEEGSPQVQMGIYAAILFEMGAWPEILHILHRGKAATLRYNNLVYSELSPQIKSAEKIAQEALIRRAEREKKRIV